MIRDNYILGLDLGQQNDSTVLSMIKVDSTVPKKEYHLVYLQKYRLRTSYPDIVSLVVDFLSNPAINNNYTLIVDYTGVGRPIVDLLNNHSINLVALNITSGSKSNWKNGREVSVPKKDLVSSMQVSFQSGKFKISSGINFLQDLKKEFINFKATINTTGARFNAASGYHDDIVMSVGIAIWYCEHIYNSSKRRVRIMTGS